MHNFVFIKYKFSILLLIIGLYSRTELKNLGFNFSNKQFNTALKKIDNQIFNLSDYQRVIPFIKSKINKETFELIIKFLLQNSRLLIFTCSLVKLSYSLKNTTINYNYSTVYYLKKFKKTIYSKLKTQYPNLKLSLNKFYKLCFKNFKKVQKKTDMYSICVEKEKLKIKL